MPLLELRNLSIAFGPHPVVQDLDLTVGRGETVGVGVEDVALDELEVGVVRELEP